MSEYRKSIFITGAASGMGRETAKLFVAKGWFVGAYDVNEEGLASLKQELGEDSCITAKLDVTDRTRFMDVMAQFGEKTGGTLDLMFNNAGIGTGGAFADQTLEEMDAVIDVNFKGVVNGIHYALPLLKSTPNSLCFTTSSASGMFGLPGISVYSATKHAVKGLTEALSVEFAAFDVRAADILPGAIDTPILGPDARVSMVATEGPWVLTDPSEVAETVWQAYHDTKLHWYVPRSMGAAEHSIVASPENIRDNLMNGTLPT